MIKPKNPKKTVKHRLSLLPFSNPSIKVNLCMYACMYVCMYVRPSHKTSTIRQNDFRLGRFAADDPRMCMCAFGAVWTFESIIINTISCHVMLFCFFFCVESMSENTDSVTLSLQPTLWSKVELHLNGLLWSHPTLQDCTTLP